jgi:hypothetical protein
MADETVTIRRATVTVRGASAAAAGAATPCQDSYTRGPAFRANVRLSNLANDTLAAAGELCSRVPDGSIDALLASGKISAVGTSYADTIRNEPMPPLPRRPRR